MVRHGIEQRKPVLQLETSPVQPGDIALRASEGLSDERPLERHVEWLLDAVKETRGLLFVGTRIC